MQRLRGTRALRISTCLAIGGAPDPQRAARARGWLVSAAALLLFCSGCSLFDALFREEQTTPAYDVRGKTILVVPFRDATLWHGESELGHEMSRNLLYWLQQCENVESLFNTEIDTELANTLDDPDWCGYGRRTEAELVVTGKVDSFSCSDPKTIGMMRGNLNVTFEVWDVAANALGYKQSISVIYPPDLESGSIEIALDQNEQDFRRQVFAEAAERIKAILCGEVLDTAARRSGR
ncbi:MAG: hypothetical protein L0Z55_09210 [Planctomycetes bacterium]|nr:hypothetical protein [Planctomycetota bacterium]